MPWHGLAGREGDGEELGGEEEEWTGSAVVEWKWREGIVQELWEGEKGRKEGDKTEKTDVVDQTKWEMRKGRNSY